MKKSIPITTLEKETESEKSVWSERRIIIVLIWLLLISNESTISLSQIVFKDEEEGNKSKFLLYKIVIHILSIIGCFFFQFLIFNNWPSEKWLSRIHLHYKGSSILPLDDRIRTLLQLYSTNLETMDASSKKSVSHVVSFVSLQRRQPKTPLEQSMMISLGCLSNGIPWYVSWGFWFCGLFWFLVLADDFQPWIKIWICDLEKKISVCIYRWELLWSSYLKYFEWWRGKWSWDMDYEEHMELSSNLQLRFETANIIVSIRWQTLVCPTNIRK